MLVPELEVALTRSASFSRKVGSSSKARYLPLGPWVWPPVELGIRGGHPTRDQSERLLLFHVRDALSQLGSSLVLLFPPAPSSGPQQTSASCCWKDPVFVP